MLTEFQVELHGVKMEFVRFKVKEDTATQLQIADAVMRVKLSLDMVMFKVLMFRRNKEEKKF